MADLSSTWNLWVDTGGTFTDCIALDPRGRIRRAKVLSSSTLRGYIRKAHRDNEFLIDEKWQVPDNFIAGYKLSLLHSTARSLEVSGYQASGKIIETSTPIDPAEIPSAFEIRMEVEAPILAAHIVTQTPLAKKLPGIDMRLATTRGTNALLERRGAGVVLFITRGFRDLLSIGTQQRPDIFALEIVKPAPLYAAVIEVDERRGKDGEVLRPLDETSLIDEIRNQRADGFDTAAIACMHSYLNPDTEFRIATLLREHGFRHVSCSAELSPTIKILPRAETSVVNAYLAPILESYLANVAVAMPHGRLHIMTSAGGLVEASQFRAKDSLLSGPAGGVVGAALAGRRSGFERIIAFDMGGTSTDVARIDGDFEYVFEHQIGDAHLVGNALAIESVAAGGGSICRFDGFRTTVGPESAGANPGPACYGAGGPLTITDVNLLLGRLEPERFEIPIVVADAEAQFEKTQSEIASGTGHSPVREELLSGFFEIANERMADAIRRVSVRKGYDPAEFVLVSFGGAGGQHACAIARRLDIKTIVVPQDASLLSAYGLGHAMIERFAERQVLRPLSGVEAEIPEILAALKEQALSAVKSEVAARTEVLARRQLINLRFIGQDSVLTVEYDANTALGALFRNAYEELYSHLPEGREIEVESIRVVASTVGEQAEERSASAKGKAAIPTGEANGFFDGRWQIVPTFERRTLLPGRTLKGPALIFEQHSTTAVDSGWFCRVDNSGALILALI